VIDVANMRRRISEENPRPSPWDLKNRRGGLIDLEFIVQYLMLREAASSPQILLRSTAQTLLALGEAGVLSSFARQELSDAAALLRDVHAVLTLVSDGLPATAALSEPDADTLARCLGAVDFTHLDADITSATARVRRWYDRLIEEAARRAAEEIGDSAQ
jgi:[glutamine synthetase] adenylyltransferase / [glutamine synthetase]-adenylyl-L-tyrosine phosphorylase